MVFDSVQGNLVSSEENEFEVDFLDFSGQEIYSDLRSSLHWNPRAAIIVIDATKQETLYNIDEWMNIVEKEGLSSEKIIVCMNKIDMVDFLAMTQAEINEELTEELLSPEIIISSARTRVGRLKIIDTLNKIMKNQ